MKLVFVAFAIVAAVLIPVGRSEPLCSNDALQVTHGVYTYHIFPKPNQKVTRAQAADLCHKMNGRLISLVTSLDQRWLNEVLAKTKLDQQKLNFWTSGLYDNGKPFKGWYWYKQPALYFNWAPGEPNNLNGKEFCLEVMTYRKNQWNDLACGRRRNFICTTILANSRRHFQNATMDDFDNNNNLKYILQ